jgi:hypothetical protein
MSGDELPDELYVGICNQATAIACGFTHGPQRTRCGGGTQAKLLRFFQLGGLTERQSGAPRAAVGLPAESRTCN